MADTGAAAVAAGAPLAASPLYFVETTVAVGDDSEQGYLVPLTTLGVGTTFDLSQAIEIPDSTIAGKPGDPYLYVGSSVDPIITRWEVQPDGALMAGPTLSLANYGLTKATVDNSLFFSPERAYLSDDATRQVIVWNPKTMEIVTAIPLDIDTEDGLLPWTWLSVRSDRILVTISWEADFGGDWSKFGNHVRLISIDPVSNQVVDTVDDPRCNYAFWGSTTSDGTAYYSPLSYYAPIRSMLGDDRGVDSCALRVVPAASSFDASYEVDLGSLVGGRPAGDLFFVTDDVAVIRVWHSELVSAIAADKSNWQDVINEAGFLWWRWQVGDDRAVQIPDQSPGASEVPQLYIVDGHKFLPRIAADYSATTLDEYGATGAPQPTLTGPGNIWGVVRKR